jgi:SAM-dependent methyltransferase
MTERVPVTPDRFDAALRDAAESEWVSSAMGGDLPPEVDPFSFVTLDGLVEIAGHLEACRGRLMLDLACGRGGPGLWLARRLRASLVGVDFSPVGIEHARVRAVEIAPEVQARYVVRDAADTGLSSASVDGAICIDAVQLMDRQREVVREMRRVLKPQGRAVFTTWEDDLLPDITALLGAGGFDVEAIEERSEWLARERAIFERALRDAPLHPDDRGLQGLADEKCSRSSSVLAVSSL